MDWQRLFLWKLGNSARTITFHIEIPSCHRGFSMLYLGYD